MGSLLLLLGLIVIFFAFVRTFSRDLRWGLGGVLAEFIYLLIVLPFRIAWVILRGLVALWAHSRSRRVRLPGDRPGDRAVRAMERWAAWCARRAMRRRPPLPQGARTADDDPGFDQWWEDTHGDDDS